MATLARIRPGSRSIRQALLENGFQERLSTDHRPPVAEYVLGQEESGFYLEFLAPLVGGAVKRGGRVDATAIVAGVSVQKLRYLELLLAQPWEIALSARQGFPLGRSTLTVRVANPVAFITQKILVLPRRHPGKQAKDLLYIHDTFILFADAISLLRETWGRVAAEVPRAQLATFGRVARAVSSQATDALRGALRVARAIVRDHPPSTRCSPSCGLASRRSSTWGPRERRHGHGRRSSGHATVVVDS